MNGVVLRHGDLLYEKGTKKRNKYASLEKAEYCSCIPCAVSGKLAPAGANASQLIRENGFT